jgi:predicted MFS family arabinose efflux permease
MLQRPAATDPATAGWGSSALRRATLTLAISQLVSWGVLFYGFAVTASAIRDDTGWSEALISGAFTVGLLIAGLGAPYVARALARHDPRVVFTAGSLLGIVGMLTFAAAPNPAVLYLAWLAIGAAMAATLYEPAMAVLVAIDPARRYRTLTVVTVAGGLASTVFAPLGAALVDTLGWRQALAVLGVGGGIITALLHAVVLPAPHAHLAETQVAHRPAPTFDRRLRRLRGAVILEQAAMIATTAYLIALLVDRGVTLATASAALAVMGLGKVAGRLLLLGPIGRRPLTLLATIATVIQLAGLALPLGITTGAVLLPSMLIVGAASGATTVLRPLLVVDLVGAPPFAATNASIQRSSTFARAAAPLLLGAAVTTFGWSIAWGACLAAFALAAERYVALGRS